MHLSHMVRRLRWLPLWLRYYGGPLVLLAAGCGLGSVPGSFEILANSFGMLVLFGAAGCVFGGLLGLMFIAGDGDYLKAKAEIIAKKSAANRPA